MLRTNMALQLKLSGNARVTRSNAYGAQAPDSIPEKLSDGSCTEWKQFSDAYPKKIELQFSSMLYPDVKTMERTHN